MASTYTPIASTTLASASSSITFSSLGSYTDIVIIMKRVLDLDGGYYIGLRFNSDSGTNYSQTEIYGNGTNIYSGRESNKDHARVGYGSTVWGTTITQVMNFSNSSTYKTVLSRNNTTNESVQALVSTWRNTSPITSINITSQSGSSFQTGSIFTLYGIQAA